MKNPPANTDLSCVESYIKERIAALRINQRAHYAACEKYSGWSKSIGILISALSTICLGFTFYSEDLGTNLNINLLALGSLVVAVLSSLQTFSDFAGRAAKHQQAAIGYGKLLREFEARLSTIYTDEENKLAIARLLDEWSIISQNAPVTKFKHRLVHGDKK